LVADVDVRMADTSRNCVDVVGVDQIECYWKISTWNFLPDACHTELLFDEVRTLTPAMLRFTFCGGIVGTISKRVDAGRYQLSTSETNETSDINLINLSYDPAKNFQYKTKVCVRESTGYPSSEEKFASLVIWRKFLGAPHLSSTIQIPSECRSS
jgi:hypothetical protein